ncbi:hypothetical protein PLESTM_001519900 [Pleodorina starrii]|nr:hypothetical protein PLESTM_001519900 [Pleodorina starrii]
MLPSRLTTRTTATTPPRHALAFRHPSAGRHVPPTPAAAATAEPAAAAAASAAPAGVGQPDKPNGLAAGRGMSGGGGGGDASGTAAAERRDEGRPSLQPQTARRQWRQRLRNHPQERRQGTSGAQRDNADAGFPGAGAGAAAQPQPGLTQRQDLTSTLNLNLNLGQDLTLTFNLTLTRVLTLNLNLTLSLTLTRVLTLTLGRPVAIKQQQPKIRERLEQRKQKWQNRQERRCE